MENNQQNHRKWEKEIIAGQLLSDFQFLDGKLPCGVKQEEELPE